MSASQLPAQTKMAEGRICLTAHQTKPFFFYRGGAGSRLLGDCANPFVSNFLAVESTLVSPLAPVESRRENLLLVVLFLKSYCMLSFHTESD